MLFNGTGYAVYGAGPQTMVLIHGVGLNRQVWQAQVDHFAADYRVVVYDLWGHGESRLPDDDLTLASYAEQLKVLFDRLKIETAIVVGHSMGALIAVQFALDYPEHVSALVPLNIVYRRTSTQRAAVVARAEHVLRTWAITGIEQTLHRWFADKTDAASQKKIERVGAWLAEADPVGYGRTYLLFAQSDALFVGRLSELGMPTLYMTGENDRNSAPAMSVEMAEETGRGEAAVVPDEAHMMAYISPEKINRRLRQFLEKTS